MNALVRLTKYVVDVGFVDESRVFWHNLNVRPSHCHIIVSVLSHDKPWTRQRMFTKPDELKHACCVFLKLSLHTGHDVQARAVEIVHG